MPRYLVERTFPGGLDPRDKAEAETARTAVVGSDAAVGVTWLHSYVTPDHRRSYCICDAPSPEALRVAAQANGLPVDRITEVWLLEPSRAA